MEKISEVLDIGIEDLINFNDKLVFNNYGTAHDKSFSVNYQVSSNEIKLYEDKIRLLEDKIQYLQKEIDKNFK